MKKTLLSLAVMMATVCTSVAQAPSTAHYVELNGGGSLQSYSCTGDAGTFRGTATGGNVNLRYTCFFSEHWGVFAAIGSSYAGADEHGYFGTLNRADGKKYLYRFSRGTYGVDFTDIISAGVSYRMDFGRFDITPSVGIGSIANFDATNFSFERRSRDGSTGPEYFSSKPVGKDVSDDYLINGYPVYEYPSPFVISADLQMAYGKDNMVYFFIQPGFLWTPAKLNVQYDHTLSIKKYSPSNWVEAVSYADAVDIWERDHGSTKTSFDKMNIYPMFNISLGVGVNIGNIIDKIR